ncbi:MAG: LTA synthase family protein [Oligoflexales bacterium]
MRPNKISITKSTAILMGIFIFHRILTFADLNHQIDNSGKTVHFLAFITGFLSDIWTSVLGAVLLSIGGFIIGLLGKPMLESSFRVVFIGTIAILASLHCSYVSFFHFPFIPSHFSYFTDTLFLRANFGSVFDFKVMLMLLSSFAIWKMVEMFFKRYQLSRKQEWFIGTFVILVGIGFHTLHNRYKVQWFVPENLQFNFIEGFVYKVTKKVEIPPLSEHDLVLLTERYGTASITQENIEQLILKEQQEKLNILPIGTHLNESFNSLKYKGEKPLIIVYLMESARYYDMGVYGNSRESISPQFDELADKGILFHRVWSVSNVTRGGQEAIWCGYLSGIDRSLMKERQDIHHKCLTDYPESGTSFWHHGGEGRFDNQQWFWDKHNVGSTLSISELPQDMAKTGWGTGDLSLANYSINAIESLNLSTDQPVITGMVLTVSNHIPWELPADAPKHINNYEFRGIHPSERTVYYADYALGTFISGLKKKSLWEKSIVIVTGDHGIRTPALNSSFANIPPDELNSRVPLLITGGIAENTAKHFSVKERNIYLERSQADIANFIAQTLEIPKFKSMGEHLFLRSRLSPIFADLGNSIYFPSNHTSLFKSSLKIKDRDNIPPEPLLFYISLLHFLGG